MDIYESTIQEALQELNSDATKSIRAVAAACNVSEATLRRRRKGGTTRRIAHEQHQRLTPVQEQFLVDWMIEQDAQGYPPSHARAREMAARILELNGDKGALGKKWIQKFISRNPRVASIIGRSIEAIRIHSTTPEALQAFYTRSQAAQITHQVQEQNIRNMDEHGIRADDT